MTFTDSTEQPANPDYGHVWRQPDRTWHVWDGQQWRMLHDFRLPEETIPA